MKGLQAKVRYAVSLMPFFQKRLSDMVGVPMNSSVGFSLGYLYSLKIIGSDIARGFSVAVLIAVLRLIVGIGEKGINMERERCYMANKIVREELKSRGVRHWGLAHALGVSELTLVLWLRFELSEDKQIEMLEKIEEIVKEKENTIDD